MTIGSIPSESSQPAGQRPPTRGNSDYPGVSPPSRGKPVARAAAFHDYGWLAYETAPILLEPSGETPEFRQVPTDERQLSAYQWCIDWMSSIDAYSGLLVGMHRTGLWRGRYGTVTHPAMVIRKLGPEIERFIERNEARQRQEAEAFDAGQLRTNNFIEPVPCDAQAGDAGFVRSTMHALGAVIASPSSPIPSRPGL